MSPTEALNKALVVLSEKVTEAIRELLERNHLYQRVRVSPDEVAAEVMGEISGPRAAAANARLRYEQVVRSSWSALPEFSDFRPSTEGRFLQFEFEVPHANLFCSRCDAVHAFNPVGESSSIWATDAVWEIHTEGVPVGDAVQHYAIPYLCQSCKKIPDVFLIRREGAVLHLCGRAPIETVQVPRDIPRPVKKFFSNAVVAHQSGQTLSGNFQLRTVIEQFAVQFLEEPVEAERRADAALEAYMATLPEDFKKRFPSLREVYRELSADIHAAKGSSEVFEKSRATLEEHFEARRLFRIPGPTSKAAAAVQR